ncbi:amino acid/amide ABC transporter substrate-binding protein (HAAT family) [Paraburkholderia silvatlantica]|uniref:Amino acid/amide ABC transporter substrate-binding protein (HAAT family) n=1 Tax=Paraburkholderia silvatlantica TaxID=321895 RepID=A0A2V4TF11_9BURK|nr:transporter substrate-binding domain-containing protein [Paraburkholderia silvatlantica]PYE17287.1 amino acid/amide ABC transporter substrate-binding protein (HAAT family) [Paraburkholderia silvatlantica]
MSTSEVSPDGRPGQSASARDKTVIRIGILYSLTGTYGAIGREMLNGVLMAIEESNANASFDFLLEPVIRDPGGSLDQYYAMCHELLHTQGVRHVIGCYTSASRKRVLPLIEGANALLWHSPRYEGFESSANVIYLGAAPNQHVIPLIRHVTDRYETKLYNVGSNYVWSWEINRIAREAMQEAGGTVVGEQLVPVGEHTVQAIIDDIIEKRPAIVLNTLVGESAYHFYHAWQRSAHQHGFLASNDVAKLSLTLCEPEVKLVGAQAVEGYLVSSVYFQSIHSEQNQRFLLEYRARFGSSSSPSVDTEAAYLCGVFLSRSIAACGTAETSAVCKEVCRQKVHAPQGTVHIDADNNHSYLTPRLGRCRADGQFDIFWEAPQPVKPDPYLTWVDLFGLVKPEHSGSFVPPDDSGR